MGILDRVRRCLPSGTGGPVVHRRGPGTRGEATDGLVVGLHGYGATERQLDTLLPIPDSIATYVPRAPFGVEPGFGWWLPAPTDGGIELVPSDALDRAVALAVDHIHRAQAIEAAPPDRTILVGYSQGAALALTVAARHPGLIAGVVTGAGALIAGRDRVVSAEDRGIDVLVMNGSLDPVIRHEDHRATVEAFADAGHRVVERYDHVPHVIDENQAEIAARTIADWLADVSDSTTTNG